MPEIAPVVETGQSELGNLPVKGCYQDFGRYITGLGSDMLEFHAQ